MALQRERGAGANCVRFSWLRPRRLGRGGEFTCLPAESKRSGVRLDARFAIGSRCFSAPRVEPRRFVFVGL
jgi:hypothetical protein